MNSSTEEYLNALRCGDYLQAVNWLEFLLARYEVSEGDADLLLQIAIFELIHHGFVPEDFHHIQLLYDLLYEQMPPFIEKNAYQATVLCNAAMQVMVFFDYQVIDFYSNVSLKDPKEIQAWMQRNHERLEPQKNNEELMKRYTALNQAVADSLAEARVIREQINSLLEVKHLLKLYLEKLTSVPPEGEFHAIRQGLLQSLQMYLKDKTIAAKEILEEISSFILALKKMEPHDWEMAYLDKMLPNGSVNKPFVSRIFESSANHFHFFAIKMLDSMLPKVASKESNSMLRSKP
nr:hypothetical protein [Legionella jordanis]